MLPWLLYDPTPFGAAGGGGGPSTLEIDAEFPLGPPALDGDLLGADSDDNLGRIVARYGRGFRPFRGARR
jgi:hypothetical protein